MSRFGADERHRHDRAVFAFLCRRLDAMGEEESGLYRYYRRRVEDGVGLRGYEHHLLERFAAEKRVFHVGCGVGALTTGLARAGVRCIGFEFDERRFAAAEALRAELAPVLHYELRPRSFPRALRRDDRTAAAVLLFTNAESSWIEANAGLVIQAMHRFARTVLDLRVFGDRREDEEAREALAERLRRSRLHLRPLDMHVPGTFYVELTSSRPAARLRRHAGEVGGRIAERMAALARRRSSQA